MRSRLQPRQAKLVQPSANRALAHLDPKPACDLGAQVDATPPHHFLPLRVRPCHDQGFQLSFLLGRQQRLRPGLGRDCKLATPPSL
jgi:hypothetical protein